MTVSVVTRPVPRGRHRKLTRWDRFVQRLNREYRTALGLSTMYLFLIGMAVVFAPDVA